jgi:hypothetical protein
VSTSYYHKVDPAVVIARYQELHSLAETGRELGISRERVRQIVNRAGIDTARILKTKPEKPARHCKECGATVDSRQAWYCETHRKEKHKRRYRALKANPEKYAHWRAAQVVRQAPEAAHITVGVGGKAPPQS